MPLSGTDSKEEPHSTTLPGWDSLCTRDLSTESKSSHPAVTDALSASLQCPNSSESTQPKCHQKREKIRILF